MAKEDINAFLGAETSYKGRLDFSGAVRIDGAFEGEIESDGTLVVGREAVISGQVRVGQLVLGGTLTGDVICSIRTVFHKTAKFCGTLSTPALNVEEGAILDGSLRMTGESAECGEK
ncbi:polymer-forming cytoskeletal protein [Fundidesulfovibrio butyratiphilus]